MKGGKRERETERERKSMRVCVCVRENKTGGDYHSFVIPIKQAIFPFSFLFSFSSRARRLAGR